VTPPRPALAGVGVLAALVLAACGGGTPATAPAASEAPSPAAADPLDELSADELYERAQEEGEVVVYSFTSRIAAVEAAFEAEYPGVDLVPNDISSTEQIARIRAEAGAGTAGADVAYISDAPVVFGELVREGLLTGYVPPRVADTVPEEFQRPLLANRLSTKVLMYNEEAHPDGSPVTNLWQLTQPEWQGRVVLVDPNVRGDYLDLMAEIVLRSDEMAAAYSDLTGEELVLDEGVETAGHQWIKDLYGNGAVLVDDTDNVNAAVGATGQESPPVGFTSYSDRRDNAEEGWALQVAEGAEPSPGIAFPAVLGLVPGGENPAAARLLVDFMMGDDSETGGAAFEPFYVAGDYPVREDVTPPADAVSLDELGAWVIEPEAVLEVRSDVADFLLTL
jgi:iron(III) transport system substrate-binding protein